MAQQLQLRRGTTAQIGSFTGALGEVSYDTDKDTLVLHDGSTAGGASELTALGNTFNGANQLVQLNGSGELPAIDGSNLTNLPGGAPTGAQYVVLSLDGSLSDERVLVAGTGLSLTDGGAGGNATLAIDSTVVTLTGSQTLTNKSIAASQLTGTLADARVAETNVTQHEAALSILESQIPDSTVLRRFTDTIPIAGITFDGGGSAVGTKTSVPRKTMKFAGQISGLAYDLQASDTATITIKVINTSDTTTSSGTVSISAASKDDNASITWGTGSGSFSASDRVEITITSGMSTATFAVLQTYGTRSD